MIKRDELEKITIRIRKGDKEALIEMLPHMGHNRAIRFLIANYIDTIRHKALKQKDEIEKQLKDIDTSTII